MNSVTVGGLEAGRTYTVAVDDTGYSYQTAWTTIWERELQFQLYTNVGTQYIPLTHAVTANAGDTITFSITNPFVGGATTLAYREPWTWTGGSTTVSQTYARVSGFAVPPALTPEQLQAQRLAERRRRIDHAINTGGHLSPDILAAMTPDERAAHARRAEEIRVEYEQRAQRQVVIQARAYSLLDTLLNAGQRRELERFGYFHVTSPVGNRYRLQRGRHAGNVDCWDPESRCYSSNLCVHISGQYPDGDNLAAQVLSILTDEGEFLRTANASGVLPMGMRLVRERAVAVATRPRDAIDPALNAARLVRAERDRARIERRADFALAG